MTTRDKLYLCEDCGRRYHRWPHFYEAGNGRETKVFIAHQCETCFLREQARDGLLRASLPVHQD
jgi:hypothetical protein